MTASSPDLPPRSLADLIRWQAARQGEAPACTFMGRTQSYASLNRRGDQVAQGLLAGGFGPEARIGREVEIGAHAVLEGRVTLGARCHVGHGAIIGGEPQDLKFRAGLPVGVTIGEDTFIREYVTVHRATHEGQDTRIGQRCLVMASSHVAHDCVIGDEVIIINYAGLTGHVVVEDRATIHLCARGVFFQDAWFFEPPRQIEIAGRATNSADGYHLVIGPHKFWFADDPADLATRLEKWFRFFFQEFRPRLEAVYRGRSEAAVRRLLARNGIACPECRRRVLPVPGEVGVSSEPPRGVDVPVVLPA